MSGQTFWRAMGCALLSVAVVKPAVADEQTDRLIREVTAKSASLRSMTGTLTLTTFRNGTLSVSAGTLRLMKPNMALVQIKGPMASAMSSDGKQMIQLMANQYLKAPVNPKGTGLYFSWAYQVPLFFRPSEIFAGFNGWKSSYAGKQKLGGEEFDKLVFVEPGESRFRYTMYVSANKLMKRFEIEMKGQPVRMVSEMSNVKLNPHLTAVDFAFKLPKTARLYEQPKYDANLLQVGKLAEKFDLVGLTQDRVLFDEVVKSKKAVLVNFWFYG